MKDLYVSTYRMDGRDMVMIYTTAQHLHDHSGVALKPDHWIGTIDRVDLTPATAATLDKYGWAPQERQDFDREHRHRLKPRSD